MGGSGSGKPKAELLKLDGTQIDIHGKVSKTDFFNFLNLPAEHYANLEKVMTPEQALKFRNHIVKMKVGVAAAMPMICSGARCPVKQCPFHKTKDWPIAEICPIESNLIAAWTKNYVDDLLVDIDSRTEMILVNQLVECDMIDYRANLGLSRDEEGWTLLRTDVIPAGEADYESVNLNPLLEAKDRAQSRRMKVLEALMATRKEKTKKAAMLKQREDGDTGEHWARLKSALKAIDKVQTKKPSIEAIKADAEEVARSPVEDADWEVND